MKHRSKKPGYLRRIGRALVGRGSPGRPIVNRIYRRPPPGSRAYFDAADSNRYTDAHFADASALDIASIVRGDIATLRKRCRYEYANNTYARGITDTLANDVIGPGPRLQITTGPDDAAETAAGRIEDDFRAWSEKCDADAKANLGQILALAEKQCAHTGEAFIVLVKDPDAGRREVSLRLRLVEADRVTTPYAWFGDKNTRDGIQFDDDGRPVAYYILKQHPGDTSVLGLGNDYELVAAANVIHIYDPDRPGQTRGIPRLAASLIPLAQLRRYSLATVRAAERAASVSMVVHTYASDLDVDDYEANDEIEIPHDSAVTLPHGYTATGFDAKQPTATYQSFKHEMLKEAARPFHMPYNIAAADSSKHNYASGRLDDQIYLRFVLTRQANRSRDCDRIFAAWYAEYRLAARVIPIRGAPAIATDWYWPGRQHVDPAKEANAQRIRLNSLTTTLRAEYARQGLDYRREIQQIADERTLLADLGLTIEDAAPSIAAAAADEALADAVEDAKETNDENETVAA